MITLLEQVINELKLSKASTGNKLNRELSFGELEKGDIIYVFGDKVDNKICKCTVEKITKLPNCKVLNYSSAHPDEHICEEAHFEICVKINECLTTERFFVNKDSSWQIMPLMNNKLICVATTKVALQDALNCPVVKKQPTNINEY